MPVVAGVLLDHVHVDPAQRAGLPARPVSSSVPAAASRLAVTLRLPGLQVGLPVGVVERERARCRRRQGRTRGGAPVTEQHPAEPVPLDLGHVAHQAVQGQLRGGNGPALPTGIIEALALEQQGGAVNRAMPRASAVRPGRTKALAGGGLRCLLPTGLSCPRLPAVLPFGLNRAWHQRTWSRSVAPARSKTSAPRLSNARAV